jgi:hypothetical protein
MIFTSLTFWTLLAGVLAFAIKFFVPTFPFTQDMILMFFVFLLGFVNIYPSLRYKGILGLSWLDILKSKAFLVLVVGLLGFIVRYYLPTLPWDNGAILVAVVFVLGLFNIYPEVRAKLNLAKMVAKKR